MQARAPIAAITVDLDTTPHYHAIHGLPAPPAEGADPIYAVGVSRLLDLFVEARVIGTLFVIGQDVAAPAHHALLTRAHEAGHELGNHTFFHRYDLRHRPVAAQEEDIERGEEAIASVTGAAPVGFRTPGYNLSESLQEILTRRGYLYDSSVFPCPPYYAAKGLIMAARRLGGRPSRSSMTLPQSLLAPITPYHPTPGAFWRPAAAADTPRPLQIPMCLIPGARFPVIGTSLHLLGARGFARALPLLTRAYPKLLQLELHAIDFMDADDPGMAPLAAHQPDLRVSWADKRALYLDVFKQLAAAGYTFAPLASYRR